MHAIADEYKTMTSRDRPSFAILSFKWCVDKESPFEVVLRRCTAMVETRLCSLA
jgi:hypothetical protein